MVHELIGLQDNKVDLKSIGSLPKDQQVVSFLQCHCFLVENLTANMSLILAGGGFIIRTRCIFQI